MRFFGIFLTSSARREMIPFGSSCREWMEKNIYLPVHMLDEDGEVDGKPNRAKTES